MRTVARLRGGATVRAGSGPDTEDQQAVPTTEYPCETGDRLHVAGLVPLLAVPVVVTREACARTFPRASRRRSRDETSPSADSDFPPAQALDTR